MLATLRFAARAAPSGRRPSAAAEVVGRALFSLTPIARSMRKEPTASERLLWRGLCGKQLGVRVRRQHVMAPYIADFYVAAYKLIAPTRRGCGMRGGIASSLACTACGCCGSTPSLSRRTFMLPWRSCGLRFADYATQSAWAAASSSWHHTETTS